MAEGNPMDALSGLLSNPELIKNVGELIKGAGNTGSSGISDNLSNTSNSEISAPHSALPDLSSQPDDNGTRLLYALEPYLSDKRKGNMHQIVQAVKIGKMITSMKR